MNEERLAAERRIAGERQAYALDPVRMKKRIDDALELAQEPEFTMDIPYVEAAMQRLTDEDLILSLPGNTIAQGPGLLTTGARFRHELNEAYLAGIAEGTRRIAEG